MKQTRYTTQANVSGFGSSKNARRVAHLTAEERAAIRGGAEIRIANCPRYHGHTDRIIIERGGRFYTRMPATV